MLIASTSSTPLHGVSAAIADREALGDPDLYVAIVVLNPHVAAVWNRSLIIASRPLGVHLDFTSTRPEWSTPPAAPTSEFDVTLAQVSQVEDGIRALGFAPSAVRGWILAAPVGFDTEDRNIDSLHVGEILIDLGRYSQAVTDVARFSSEAMRALEKQDNVNLAFSRSSYYRPACDRLARREKSILERRARDSKGDLEGALGMHLQLVDVVPGPRLNMLCPDIQPVTVDQAVEWAAPKIVAIRDWYVYGTARYQMGVAMPHVRTEVPSNESIEERDPYREFAPFAKLDANQYLATTSAVTVTVPPAIALLAFSYDGVPRAAIDARVARLTAIGVVARDTYFESPASTGAFRVWIRFAPATNERAKQIESVMEMQGQYEPSLALFTNDCSSVSSAIASALALNREQASKLAQGSSTLGPPFSIMITPDTLGNATCGYTSEATMDQLVHGALTSEPFPPYPEPMVARFPIRVDVAWPRTHRPAR